MGNNNNNDNNNKGKATKWVATTASDLNLSQVGKYADLNFNFRPGSEIFPAILTDTTAAQWKPVENTIPTLVRAKFVPTVGPFGSIGNSPINQATSQLFAKIRSDNAGAVNYTSANLMIFCLSMNTIWMYHSWMQKVLGLINYYSATDWNIPTEFYEALDVDIEDIRKHRVEVAAYLDNFAMQANTFAIPNVIPIITRQSALINTVYKLDDSNNMGQYLIFEPEGFYRYEENEASGRRFGTLQWEEKPHNMTYDDLVEYGDSLIRDMRASEDHYIMCGDIRKSFGTNLLTIGKTNTDYQPYVVFDEDILHSFHNARITQLAHVGEVTHDGVTDMLYQDIKVQSAYAALALNYNIVLDIADWDPTPVKVCENMRWITAFESDGQGGYDLIASGPEIITEITIFTNDGTGSFNEYYFTQFNSAPPFVAVGGASVYDKVIEDLMKSAFFRTQIGNKLPVQYWYDNSTTTDGKHQYFIGKYRCATIVTPGQVVNINKLVFNGLFGIGNY